MKKNAWIAAALALAISPVMAADKNAKKEEAAKKEIAATFVGEAHGNTVAVYSNSKRARRCEVVVNYTVMQNG